MKRKIYGYVRISTSKQNIERQIRNILSVYPDAIIVREIFTGTTIDRREFNKLLKTIEKDLSEGYEVTIVFDAVARMSRTADEGFLLYKGLYSMGVHLVFLKEPHINTDVLKKAMERPTVPMTGTNVDIILKAVNDYLLALVEEQIKLAFENAELEVERLHQRTREGIETARLNGKQIGRPRGKKEKTKRYLETRDIILKHDKEFGGNLDNKEMMALCKLSHNSYYAYKKLIRGELLEKVEGGSSDVKL